MENSADIQTQTDSEHDPNGIAKGNTSVWVKPRRWKIIAVVCALTLAGVAIYSVYPKQPHTKSAPGDTEELIEEASPPALQDTELFFEPAGSVRMGTQQSFPIGIRTGANTVSAVELVIRYDPKYLTNVTIDPGTFLTNPTVLTQTVKVDEGTALLTIGTLSPRQGEGVIATLRATITAASSSAVTLAFDPATQVAGIGERTSVVRETTNLTVPIGP